MASEIGGSLIESSVVFGYDTGYGVADNYTATRFYPGEPTTNYVTDASLLESGWTGSYSLIDSATKSFQFNVSNFHTDGAGWRSFMWDMRAHAGSAVTISATIEIPDDSPGDWSWVMIGQANSRANGTTTATYLGYSTASERYQKTTKNTERISWSGTIGNTGTANQPNGIIGFTVWYNGGTSGTNSFIKVSNVQIEKIAHATPFVNGTRSSTTGLIDLKETRSINISNTTFDSSGQMNFDASDDMITIDVDSIVRNSDTITIEGIVNANSVNAGGPWAILTDHASAADKDGFWWHYNINSATYFRVEDSTNGEQGVTFSGSVPFVSNANQHVVTVVGLNHVLVYVNGELEKSYTPNFVWSKIDSSKTAYLYIGRTYPGYYLAGEVPVFKMHNRELTASEVKQNYQSYKKRFNL